MGARLPRPEQNDLNCVPPPPSATGESVGEEDRWRCKSGRFPLARNGREDHMTRPEEFPGFSSAADHQEQVDRAMALLGRHADLEGSLHISPDPARKWRTGGWGVFGFRRCGGAFNENPHLLSPSLRSSSTTCSAVRTPRRPTPPHHRHYTLPPAAQAGTGRPIWPRACVSCSTVTGLQALSNATDSTFTTRASSRIRHWQPGPVSALQLYA